MPQHVYIADLGDHVGSEVTLKGWLSAKRSSGKIRFLVLRDGTGYVQCVALAKNVLTGGGTGSAVYSSVSGQSRACAVRLTSRNLCAASRELMLPSPGVTRVLA